MHLIESIIDTGEFLININVNYDYLKIEEIKVQFQIERPNRMTRSFVSHQLIHFQIHHIVIAPKDRDRRIKTLTKFLTCLLCNLKGLNR